MLMCETTSDAAVSAKTMKRGRCDDDDASAEGPSHTRQKVPIPRALKARSCEFLFLQVLAHAGVPDAIILLVASAQLTVPWSERATLDHVEFFAGCKSVTKAFLDANQAAVAFEKKDHAILNMNTAAGYLGALTLILRLRWGGAALAAPVCSSWVWISRSVTRRSWFDPLGDFTKVSGVRQGNLMVSRLVALCYVMSAMGVSWIIEQPANSLMQWHPRWQTLLAQMNVFRHHIFMSDFGSLSSKPTWLYSTSPWLHDVERHRTKHTNGKVKCDLEVSTQTRRPDGTMSVSGGKDLKATQAYPLGFGRAVCRLQSDHRSERQCVAQRLREHALADETAAARVESVLARGLEGCADLWQDANFAEVFALLRQN